MATRPRGRRPGNNDTRGTIRDTARALFTSRGYEAVSLRGIAREAEVDPALVHHYFASKAGLFAESVLELEVDVDALVARILDGPRATIGRRAARAFFALWDCPERRQRYLAQLLRSGAPHPCCLDEFMAREVFAKVAAAQGHADAPLRGQLAASATLGVMMGRHVLRLPVLSGASVAALTGPLAGTLQHYLVDEW